MNGKFKIFISEILNRFGIFVSSTKTLPKANLSSFLHKLKGTGYKPELILDIGANKSSWSKEASLFFPQSEYFLVEPQVELNDYLDSFCLKHKNSKYINCGVGAKSEEKLFTLIPDTVSSTFNITIDEVKMHGYKQRLVKITTINEIIKENLKGRCPDIIKIDAEGSEYDILLGASEAIGTTEIILIELHFFKSDTSSKDFSDMIIIMKNYGYVPLDFSWFMPRPHDKFPGLTEVAFALENGKIRKYKGW
ncbi:MAG: FkbM family methyltransferase [Chitinophagaceae bacterium]